jgi:hypothetical protein
MAEYSTVDTLFQGVVQGCMYGQQDRVDDLNERIQSRQFTDTNLRPNYDPRPVQNKYSRFSIIDPKLSLKINEPLKTYDCKPYLANSNVPIFYAASNNATIMRNIDLETNLRNQTIALQHGAAQGVYVPSSKSDLYRVAVPESSNVGEQPFPDLFTSTKIQNPTTPSIHKYPNIGKSPLFNHTRTQLRNTAQV